jgi:hypothetical protein
MLGGFDGMDVEKRGQAAAGADFGSGPVVVSVGGDFDAGHVVAVDVELPDAAALLGGRQVEEEDAVEALGPAELGRQAGNVVAGADEEDVGGVVVVE